MRASRNTRLPLEAMNYIINHAFLPPKLPLEDDSNPRYEGILLDTVSNALDQFKEGADHEEQQNIEPVMVMMKNLATVRDDSGFINEQKLENLFQTFSAAGDIVPLQINVQNAGVLISRFRDNITLEAFELSPSNKAVFETKGRLRRSFPACAFTISEDIFNEEGFWPTLAHAIAKMSYQSAPDMQPKVMKTGQQIDENRDTTHPKMVTEHLASILRALGKAVGVSTISKNTREEVLWSSSLLPWRRSPMWLLLRVAMQLVFSRPKQPTTAAKNLYKRFMIFFMAHLTELSLTHAHFLDSDVLLAMNAKLSRRLLKFGPDPGEFWIGGIQKIMYMTSQVLDTRWEDTMNRAHPDLDLDGLRSLDFKAHTTIQLTSLDEYIAAIARRQRVSPRFAFEAGLTLPRHIACVLPKDFDAVTEDHKFFVLAAFESWVESSLDKWLSHNLHEVNTCGELRSAMEIYHSDAASQYTANPERFSVMVLTIMEVWVACDKSACELHNLLQDYAPEIPIEELQSLILPLRSQMQRLYNIEQYLRSRKLKAKTNNSSVFLSSGHLSSFSVRYFDQSQIHQALLSSIEQSATSEREAKKQELRQKKGEYTRLMGLLENAACEWYEVIVDAYNDIREEHHKISCKRCQYLDQANSIRIEIHEWPLPNSSQKAKSAVFELMLPVAFGDWRDFTAFVIGTVFSYNYATRCSPRAFNKLEGYQGLHQFWTRNSLCNQRIGFLSEVKPHIITHRRDKQQIMNLTETDVCLKNGMQYQYFDIEQGLFTCSYSATDELSRQCTYKLPERSSSMQKFLERPYFMPSGLPPNHVLARQSDCPDHICLDEFKAFSTLPLGYLVQWKNILIQLPAPSLDFTKPETTVLLLQIINQAGPTLEGAVRRASHMILDDEKFGLTLLIELQQGLQRIKENWESLRALASFIYLTARLISLASSVKVQSKCLEYLALSRLITIQWMKTLLGRAQSAMEDSERKEFLSTAIEIALVCVNSFDVDQNHLITILTCSAEASIWIQCSVIVQQYSQCTFGQRDAFQTIMLERWKVLSYRAYQILIGEILEKGSSCLDDAIKKSWPDFRSGHAWNSVDSPHQQWLRIQTVHDSEEFMVHFNALTAEVLVNGLPLARLPSKYESHPLYQTLFGRSTLEVVPNWVPGMELCAKHLYAGHKLHFGMQPLPSSLYASQSDLLLRAVLEGQAYDLIPKRLFQNRFPIAFIDEFVHWFEHSSNSIEFRPINKAWFPSSENWRLMKIGCCWRLVKNNLALVDYLSETGCLLSRILAALEDSSNTHLILDEASGTLEIGLPRLQLGFSLSLGTSLVYSRQFRGMYLDTKQNIGTLIGLQNKLVLKRGEASDERLLIIPENPVTYQKVAGHICAKIERGVTDKVHAYHMDRTLGRIVDNGDLQSKLFLCYLHAITSSCLPDPLIHRTGTENALSILNSAAVRSFDCLSKDNLRILGLIAKLPPRRMFYPANQRVMQLVTWDPALNILSQHGDFYVSVKEIFEDAENRKIFYMETYNELPSLGSVVPYLLERDLIRSSTFRACGFGAEHHTNKYDTEYVSRDRGQNSDRALPSFVTATLAFQRRAVLHTAPRPGLGSRLWGILRYCGSIEGPEEPLDWISLKFDARWLKDSRDLLGTLWCRIHQCIGRSTTGSNRFYIMMWLSLMAFAECADMEVVHMLTAIYNVPHVAHINVPGVPRFYLSEGDTTNVSSLAEILRAQKRSLHDCPEASLPKMAVETEKKARQRRQREYERNVGLAIKNITTSLTSQWPCEIPQNSSMDSTYIDMNLAMPEVKLIFKKWFDNNRFRNYLNEIEDVLLQEAVGPVLTPDYFLARCKQHLQGRKCFVNISDLFSNLEPLKLPEAPEMLQNLRIIESAHSQKPLDWSLYWLAFEIKPTPNTILIISTICMIVYLRSEIALGRRV